MTSLLKEVTTTWFAGVWTRNIEEAHPFVVHGIYNFLVQVAGFWIINMPFILIQFQWLPKRWLDFVDQYKIDKKVHAYILCYIFY